MKRARRVGLIVLCVALVVLGALYGLARSSHPAVPLDRDIENEDEAALTELFRSIGDPRELEDDSVVTVRLDQAQVSALAAEASRRRALVSARARLRDGGLDVVVAAESPRRWITPYINLEASIGGPPSAPRVESARLGWLPVPAAVGQALVDAGLDSARRREHPVLGLLDAVQDVTYGAETVIVRVRWTRALREQVMELGRQTVRSDLDLDALRAYGRRLNAILERERDDPVRLTQLMTPLFALAVERTAEGHDPRRELEAAMLVLTLDSLGRPLSEILDDAPPMPAGHAVVLYERDDLPRHFLVSATATLFVDRTAADALGLGKELRDSDDSDGSGFSFRDLAADRAATRLMDVGTRSPAHLRSLIRRLANPMTEQDLVPEVGDLPEGLDSAAFHAAYSDAESEAYRSLIAQIDARIDACAVHRAVVAADREP